MESGLNESFTSAASKLDVGPALLGPSPFEKAPTHVATLPLVFSCVCLSSRDPLQSSHTHGALLLQSFAMEGSKIVVARLHPENLMMDLQVGAELKKGGVEGPEQLLRLGSALDAAQNHLIACSSAREGFDRDLISPRPCSEEQPRPASQAAAAGRALHDSPDSLTHAEELTRATSLEQLPLMLRRQLADDVVAAGLPHAVPESARQPEQAAQLGTFCWGLAEQRTGGHTPFHDAASIADSGETTAL